MNSYTAKFFGSLILACLVLSACSNLFTWESEQIVEQDGLPQLVLWPSDEYYSQDQVVLKLVVKVGSLHEQGDQLGYAHFVEHMAFNGTSSFPKQQLQQRLKELGLTLGVHSNAYTHYDHTEFTITLNTNDDEKIASAIEVLSEWYQAIEFDPTEVENERAIILNEYQLYETEIESAFQKMSDAYFAKSRFAERPILGTRESILDASSDELREFYNHWYRPENSAVIVVGDINEKYVRNQFTKYFVSKNSSGYLPSKQYGSDQTETPTTLAVSDDYVTSDTLTFSFVVPMKEPVTKAEVIQQRKLEAALSILKQRLDNEISSSSSIVDTGWEWHYPNSEQLMARINLTVKDGHFDSASELLESHLQALKETGIGESELNSWRTEIIANEQQYEDDVELLASSLQDQFIANFPVIGQEEWIYLLETELPKFTVSDINETIRFLLNGHRKVYVSARSISTLPESEELSSWLTRSVSPVEIVIDGLAESEPELDLTFDNSNRYEIVEKTKYSNSVVEWKLGNGFRVLFAHDDSDVAYVLTNAGGLNSVSEADVPASRMWANVAMRSGLRNLSSTQLESWLMKEGMQLYPMVDFNSRGFFGSSSTDNFKKWMNLLHLALTEQATNEDAFIQVKQLFLDELDNLASAPNLEWIQLIDQSIYNNDPALRALTVGEVLVVDFEGFKKVHDKYFLGAQNRTLAIVGDLSERVVENSILKYIATIPKSDPTLNYQPRIANGNLESGSFEGLGSGEKTTQITLRYKIPYSKFSEEDREWHILIESWLNDELFAEIREEQGLVYYIDASLFSGTVYEPFTYLIIDAQTDTKSAALLTESIQSFLQELTKAPPSSKEVATWMQSIHEESVQSSRDYEVIAHRLALGHLYRIPLESVFKSKAATTSLTGDDLTRYLKSFLGDSSIKTVYTYKP